MHPSRTPLHPIQTPMRDPGGVFVLHGQDNFFPLFTNVCCFGRVWSTKCMSLWPCGFEQYMHNFAFPVIHFMYCFFSLLYSNKLFDLLQRHQFVMECELLCIVEPGHQ